MAHQEEQQIVMKVDARDVIRSRKVEVRWKNVTVHMVKKMRLRRPHITELH